MRVSQCLCLCVHLWVTWLPSTWLQLLNDAIQLANKLIVCSFCCHSFFALLAKTIKNYWSKQEAFNHFGIHSFLHSFTQINIQSLCQSVRHLFMHLLNYSFIHIKLQFSASSWWIFKIVAFIKEINVWRLIFNCNFCSV